MVKKARLKVDLNLYMIIVMLLVQSIIKNYN